MKIDVIIRNITPIFSAAPGSASVSLDGTINPPGGGFPLIRTRTMPVAADTGDGVVKSIHLPIVPGNTMRSLLRRTMLKNIVEPALMELGGLSIGAYAGAYAGNASGNPDGIAPSFDEISGVRSHPFLGLFGGGPRMIEGRLKAGNLYPIHTHATRIIGNGHEDRMIQGKITDVIWQRREDPILRLKTNDDVAVIKGGVKEANAWITEINAATLAAADKRQKSKTATAEPSAEDSGGRGLKAFNAHEVVIPGIDWIWTINIDNPTPAQTGLILLALKNLDKLGIAGGHAKDYGRFSVERVNMDGKTVLEDGNLSEETTQYVDAIAEAMDTLNPDDFESFIASLKPTKQG